MEFENQYKKPLPEILPETEAYWRAAARDELVIQQCGKCGQLIFFPRLMCYNCLSEDMRWVPSAGLGTVYSYTVIHRAADESFSADVPYVYAIIDLDEGVRMISNVIGTPPDQVRIGMRVQVVFEKAAGGMKIPKFRPLEDSA